MYPAIPGMRHDVALAPFTSLQLGGPAAHFLEATSLPRLREALAWVRASGMRMLVLGGGSNLVVPDEGFDGLVLQVGLRGTSFTPGEGTVTLRAAAGEPWDPLVATAVRRGHGGLECLSGIPGLVGGTPIQNVGAYGQDVAETIRAVEVIDRATLEASTLSPGECGFGYRTSRFKHADVDRFIVTAVTWELAAVGTPALRYRELASRLEEAPPRAAGAEAMSAVREAVLELRRGKAMVLDPGEPDSRSAGSFFTNPVLSPDRFAALAAAWRASGHPDPVPSFAAADGIKVPAAWLVEQAGFTKGLTVDGIGISNRHALAIVNRGGTTAALLALVARIQAQVEARFGVRLVPEPVIVR